MAPCPASFFAVARPMPEAAPATAMILFLKCAIGVNLVGRSLGIAGGRRERIVGAQEHARALRGGGSPSLLIC